MAMKDMALTKAEAKEQETSCCPSSDDGDDLPKYPYGLTLYLNSETLEKLGVSAPPVGQKLMLTAEVICTSYSKNQRQGGEPSECADLQVTSMDLTASLRSDADRAAKLYPTK